MAIKPKSVNRRTANKPQSNGSRPGSGIPGSSIPDPQAGGDEIRSARVRKHSSNIIENQIPTSTTAEQQPAFSSEQHSVASAQFSHGSGIPFPSSFSGVVEAILSVGSQRRSLLAALRSALLSGNVTEALLLARQLCGLPLEVTQ